MFGDERKVFVSKRKGAKKVLLTSGIIYVGSYTRNDNVITSSGTKKCCKQVGIIYIGSYSDQTMGIDVTFRGRKVFVNNLK